MTGIGRPTRVLAELSHGSHALVDNNPEAEKSLQEPGTDSALSRVVNESVSTAEHVGTTSFGYLFASLSAMFPHEHLPSSTPEETRTTVDALNALGDAMVDHENSPVADSTIPPVHTYWGQFVDHDITANTDRDTSIDITGDPLVPIAPREVLRRLENLRSPALNLDSVCLPVVRLDGLDGTSSTADARQAAQIAAEAVLPCRQTGRTGDLPRLLGRRRYQGTALGAADRTPAGRLAALRRAAGAGPVGRPPHGRPRAGPDRRRGSRRRPDRPRRGKCSRQGTGPLERIAGPRGPCRARLVDR